MGCLDIGLLESLSKILDVGILELLHGEEIKEIKINEVIAYVSNDKISNGSNIIHRVVSKKTMKKRGIFI